ncbi:FAS-associated factor 2 [Diaphorina citri]|uniref:FAS-associated factor 2 n=1 Tax=Diaphorina citri TaxID=121845 RepID=A0A1S3DIK3_DIACI|nr:FAS-associated factor 2 [Diaphorina citri]
MDQIDADLTEDQQVKLCTFQELSNIDNASVCREILQRHNWDLEVAVQEQLNITEGRPTVFASEAGPPSVVNDLHRQQIFSTPSLFNQTWTPGWLPRPLAFTVSYMFRFCYDLFSSVVRLAYSILYTDPRLQLTDPLVDVGNFITHFNETYGLNHPVLYQGSYGQALSDAKQELRFLLVYLHEQDDQDCNQFCRTTLTDPEVIDYITTNNMICWACSTSTGEGYKVEQIMQPGAYPFVAIIVLKDNKMTIVGRCVGVDVAVLFALFGFGVLVLLSAVLLGAGIERSFNQSLRAQQDEDYLESLRQDQEKERLKQEQRQKEKDEEDRLRRIRELEEEKRNNIRQKKMDLIGVVPEEPSPDDTEAVKIVFKMPNGKRLERRFLNTNSVNDVYIFIFCHPDSPDYFEIATNFPRKVLCTDIEDGKDISLKKAGLNKGEVLFVNDTEE